jgi:hydroxymethylpyrimidine pyrophosphatase-like HAD family hydrolase
MKLAQRFQQMGKALLKQGKDSIRPVCFATGRSQSSVIAIIRRLKGDSNTQNQFIRNLSSLRNVGFNIISIYQSPIKNRKIYRTEQKYMDGVFILALPFLFLLPQQKQDRLK